MLQILRVVEYGSLVRVGGSAELSARTRMVAATNSDLKAKIARGTFKERLEALERELVRDALEQATGNQAHAARLLGLPYHQFRYYCSKHTRDEVP